MTSKELLIQEIETLPPELLTEALDLIRSIKLNYTKKELESIPLTDSTETSSHQEQLTYRPASGRSILRHAGTMRLPCISKTWLHLYIRGLGMFR